MTESVKIIFLGGVGEIGRNMFVLQHGRDALIMDCGIGFPDEDQLGIDLILPNIDYLRTADLTIHGFLITHGHEDHIGALPYLWPDIQAPVYATGLTIGLIRAKLEEVSLLGQVTLNEIDPESDVTIELGPFTATPFRITHSIPDCVGYGIETPAGLIVHTGDYKLDPTPIDDKPTDFARLLGFGDRGVRLLISDCTHIEGKGLTPSERVVGETFDTVFGMAPGRIIVATFASQIARIQQVLDTAFLHNRKVVILGRSMVRNAEISLELGYLTDPGHVLIAPRDASNVPPEKLVYLVTGSQGEPMAVLSRIANGDYGPISIGRGDTVIISASPIPGNETSVYRIINQLFKDGAEVVYSARALVHVSGHGSQDEIAKIVEVTRPQETLPFHGEPRMMALFVDLVAEQGIGPERVTLAEVGDVIELTPDSIAITGSVPAPPVYLDGGSVVGEGDVVIRDRQALADDGIVMIVVAIDRETGKVVAGPELVTRGFVHVGGSGELLDATKERLRGVLSNLSHEQYSPEHSPLSRQLRNTTQKFLEKETGRRPMVLPVVMLV